MKTEADPFDPDPLPKTRRSMAAIQYLERKVVEAGGLALRYGWLYGAPDGASIRQPTDLGPRYGEGLLDMFDVSGV